MITKHEDENGNEYLSKLIDPFTFLIMDSYGKMYEVSPIDFDMFVKKNDLKVISFISET